MLYRKIAEPIRQFLANKDNNKVLVVQGARQVGKSFILRHVCHELFANVMELNLVEDKEGDRLFADVHTVDDFYLRLSMLHGNSMNGTREDSVVLLDEIQEYPQFITLLKFLNADGRFTYVASGSLLGVTLNYSTSIPVGSLRIMDMFPLDFEEFLRANSVGQLVIDTMRKRWEQRQSLDEAMHSKLMDLWRKYLLVGGMPDAVNEFLLTQNVANIRAIQSDIIRLYAADAGKYDQEHRLKIRRVYEMIPSNMENKKKRVVAKEIEGKEGSRFAQYREEFDYLVSSGIALEATAVTNPKYPLAESVTKNLLKLYMNDPGLLTSVLYGDDPRAVLDTECSVNLGSVYETAVAAELRSLGHKLYYYDNKKKGEVDFLINNRAIQSVVPIEVKSGKDYSVHSAIDRFVETPDYHVKQAFVVSNNREIATTDGITETPIYNLIFF